MKRDALQGDYERLRREAGLPNRRPEFPEPRADDMFERAAGDAHREMIEAAKLRNAKLDAQLAIEEAARAESHRLKVAKANADLICAQYRKAGVDPLQVDFDGVPTVSLPLLLQMGWKIDGGVLVSPTGVKQSKGE